MEKTLFDSITYEGKYALFGLPTTEELTGRTALLPDGAALCFGEELAVKCDDDLFLAEKEGRLYLIKEQPDESLQALDAVKTATDAPALPAPLEGWETELSFASGYVLKAEFADEKLTLSPSPEPVMGANPFTSGNAAAPEAPEAPPVTFALKAVETDEKRFLFHLPETGETVLFNARRFLFYALLRGRVVTGFAEIPPR